MILPSAVRPPSRREISAFSFLTSAPPGAVANYLYVEDLADALALCGLSPRAAGVYNLSDDRTFEAFIEAISRALGRQGSEDVRLPE